MDDEDDARSARAPEPDDAIRVCRALNESGARYLLIGGSAIVAHGAGRFTKDIDQLVDDAPENVARVKRGLCVLADNAAAEVADQELTQRENPPYYDAKRRVTLLYGGAAAGFNLLKDMRSWNGKTWRTID